MEVEVTLVVAGLLYEVSLIMKDISVFFWLYERYL